MTLPRIPRIPRVLRFFFAALLALVALPALAADEGLGKTVEPIVGARCRLFEVAADAYREEASDGIFPLKAAYGNRTPGILPEEVLKRCFDGTLERLPGIKLLWEDSFAATRGEAARFSVGPLPSATGRPLRLDLAASASFDDRANAAFFDVDFSLRPDGAGDDAPAVVLGSGKSQRVWWGGGYAVVARPVPRAEDSVPPYYLAVIGNWEHDGYRSVPVRPVGREVLDARYAEAAERGRDVLAEALCADFDAPVHRIYRLDAPSRTNLVAWFRGPDAPRPVPADPDLCTEALRALFVAAGGALSTNAVPGGDGDLFSDRTAEFLRYVPQTDSWIVLAPADRQDYFRKCLEGTIADDGLGPILLPSPSGSSENKRIDPPVIRPVFHSRLDPPADVASAALAARFGHPATNAPALARRVYPWTPALAELPYLGLDDPERAPGDALRAFAEGFGVAFPEGSWVKALPEAGRIVAMSDEPSLDAFGALLDCLEKAVHDRIEVSFAVLSVDAGDLAPMLERIGATNAAPGGAAAAAPPVLATAPSLGDLFARVGCDWTNRFAVPLSTRNVGWDRTASFGGFRSGGVSRPAGRSWAFEETAGGGRAVVPREAGGTVLHRNGPRLEAVPARIAGERDALRLEIRYEESDRFLGCERPDPSVGLPTRAADGSFALRPAPFEEVAMRFTPTSRSLSLPLRLRDGEAVLLRPAVPPEPLSGARAIPLRVPVVSARRLPEVGEPVEPGPFGRFLHDRLGIDWGPHTDFLRLCEPLGPFPWVRCEADPYGVPNDVTASLSFLAAPGADPAPLVRDLAALRDALAAAGVRFAAPAGAAADGFLVRETGLMGCQTGWAHVEIALRDDGPSDAPVPGSRRLVASFALRRRGAIHNHPRRAPAWDALLPPVAVPADRAADPAAWRAPPPPAGPTALRLIEEAVRRDDPAWLAAQGVPDIGMAGARLRGGFHREDSLNWARGHAGELHTYVCTPAEADGANDNYRGGVWFVKIVPDEESRRVYELSMRPGRPAPEKPAAAQPAAGAEMPLPEDEDWSRVSAVYRGTEELRRRAHEVEQSVGRLGDAPSDARTRVLAFLRELVALERPGLYLSPYNDSSLILGETRAELLARLARKEREALGFRQCELLRLRADILRRVAWLADFPGRHPPVEAGHGALPPGFAAEAGVTRRERAEAENDPALRGLLFANVHSSWTLVPRRLPASEPAPDLPPDAAARLDALAAAARDAAEAAGGPERLAFREPPAAVSDFAVEAVRQAEALLAGTNAAVRAERLPSIARALAAALPAETLPPIARHLLLSFPRDPDARRFADLLGTRLPGVEEEPHASFPPDPTIYRFATPGLAEGPHAESAEEEPHAENAETAEP